MRIPKRAIAKALGITLPTLRLQEATVKVNEEHFERAAGVVTEAMRKAIGAGVDRGAMVMAFLSIAVDCPPSALMRQIGWVEEGRISGSS